MKILKTLKKTHQSASLLILIKTRVAMKLSRSSPNKAWKSLMQGITPR